ncbi:hypothetical protein CBR_g24435 [Chara braunii]|uniref:Codanin-1 C-terminal domain-containing protein n=1 Tax=Chara braunii TaxID=69332 RepID=A0A388JN10_CHABU|nr:hypothetical protein CBR_g24435 [Chara braunii]|eukprot:GBG59092.1 hypothetical protein CBR_g24435 [Chara braunii]
MPRLCRAATMNGNTVVEPGNVMASEAANLAVLRTLLTDNTLPDEDKLLQWLLSTQRSHECLDLKSAKEEDSRSSEFLQQDDECTSSGIVRRSKAVDELPPPWKDICLAATPEGFVETFLSFFHKESMPYLELQEGNQAVTPPQTPETAGRRRGLDLSSLSGQEGPSPVKQMEIGRGAGRGGNDLRGGNDMREQDCSNWKPGVYSQHLVGRVANVGQGNNKRDRSELQGGGGSRRGYGVDEGERVRGPLRVLGEKEVNGRRTDGGRRNSGVGLDTKAGRAVGSAARFAPVPLLSDEDEFPALGSNSPSPAKPVKNSPKQVLQKRIAPTPTRGPLVGSAFVISKTESSLRLEMGNVEQSKHAARSDHNQSDAFVKVDVEALMNKRIHKKQHKRTGPGHKELPLPVEGREEAGMPCDAGKEDGKATVFREDRQNAKLAESGKRANSVRRELLGCCALETASSDDNGGKVANELQFKLIRQSKAECQMNSESKHAKNGLRPSPMKVMMEKDPTAPGVGAQLAGNGRVGKQMHTTRCCGGREPPALSAALSFDSEIESRLAEIRLDEAVCRSDEISGRVDRSAGEQNGEIFASPVLSGSPAHHRVYSAAPGGTFRPDADSEEQCCSDLMRDPPLSRRQCGMPETAEDGKYVCSSAVNGLLSAVATGREKQQHIAKRGMQRRTAIVHGLLIQANLVPSVTLELHVIVQLLSLKPDYMVVSAPVADFDGEGGKEEQFWSPEGPRLGMFENGDDCAAYACLVLRHSGRVPHCVGEKVLSALVEEPAIAKHSPELLAQLTASLVHYQTSALRSAKGYDTADTSANAVAAAESPARQHGGRNQENQSSPSPGTKGTPQRGSAVPMSRPFDAARDSRLNFQTQEAQQLYNNREQCRDIFYELMREVAVGNMFEASSAYRGCTGLGIGSGRGRGGVGGGGRYGGAVGSAKSGGGPSGPGTMMNGCFTLDDGYESFSLKVRHFLSWLRPENYVWFADFLLEQIIQVASTGETDPEVTGLAGGNRAKLQRLHQRLTARGGTKVSGNSLALRSSSLSGSRSPRPGNFRDTVTTDNARGHGTEGPFMLHWRSAVSGSRSSLVFDEPSKEDGTNDGASQLSAHLHGGEKRSCDEGGDAVVGFRPESGDPSPGDIFSFLKAFSEGQRIYALFLHAADSYRLNMHLIWSIESKITSLSRFSPHSRDAAELGSTFAERVLGLRALASFLGYLVFSPLPSALTSAVPGHSMFCFDAEVGASLGKACGVQLGLATGIPPLDLLRVLQDAAKQQILTLTLPWVLEFLKMMKGNCAGMLPPYYRQLISYLWGLYRLPVLQPVHPRFGVGPFCIAAQLDGFFSFMGLSRDLFADAIPCDERRLTQNEDLPSSGDEKAHLVPNGVDDLEGLIDSRYIQNCCPLVMDLHTILTRAKKTRGGSPSPSPQRNIQQMQRLRKIRPVRPHQVLPAASTEDPDGSVIAEFADLTEENPIKLKLQRAFLEQHPHLRRLVDFAVDTVAVNSALAAAMKVLPLALAEASSKLETAILSAVHQFESQCMQEEDACGGKATLKLEAAIDEVIEETIASSIPKALEYALEHSKDRASEALAALVSPDESDQRVGVAAAIAGETAGRAACQRVLVGVPRDIRRRITEEAEVQKRKILPTVMDKWLGTMQGVEGDERQEASV